MNSQVLLLILVILLSGCSGFKFASPDQNFRGALSAGLSGDCEAILEDLYSQTYYPFLTKTCSGCHTNGPGIGSFGHSDFRTSYDAFKGLGRDKIHRQALNAAHQPAFTGPQNTPIIGSFPALWENAEAEVAVCEGKSVDTDSLITVHKSNAMILQRAGSSWTTLSWNLETEFADTQLRGKIFATINIEVRVAVISGVQRGYEFRNPSIRVHSAGRSYTIDGLRISINNQEMTDVTTYSLVRAQVNSTTNVMLAPGGALALAVMEPIASTDSFALIMGQITDDVSGAILTP